MLIEELIDTKTGPIVVIDDEPYALRALSYLLGREGYDVETAPNGEQGLQRVRDLRPAVVFLDIMMPYVDGYEVCQQIRNDPSLDGTYVIMLSAKGHPDDRARGLKAGADEYLVKPFSPHDVASHLHKLLRRDKKAVD